MISSINKTAESTYIMKVIGIAHKFQVSNRQQAKHNKQRLYSHMSI